MTAGYGLVAIVLVLVVIVAVARLGRRGGAEPEAKAGSDEPADEAGAVAPDDDVAEEAGEEEDDDVGDAGPSWECPACGEMSPETLDACWKCTAQRPKNAAVIPSRRTNYALGGTGGVTGGPTPSSPAATLPHAPQGGRPLQYKMVQIPPNVLLTARKMFGRAPDPSDAAAEYLEIIVNAHARQGWEFLRVDTIGVRTQPGCLAALFGAKSIDANYYVVTFRR